MLLEWNVSSKIKCRVGLDISLLFLRCNLPHRPQQTAGLHPCLPKSGRTISRTRSCPIPHLTQPLIANFTVYAQAQTGEKDGHHTFTGSPEQVPLEIANQKFNGQLSFNFFLQTAILEWF